jgi:hypothetical protein
MEPDLARVKCPHCRRLLRLPDAAQRRRGKCRGCGTIFRIPMLDEEALDQLVAQWVREHDAESEDDDDDSGSNNPSAAGAASSPRAGPAGGNPARHPGAR